MEAEGGLRMKTRRTHSLVQKSPVKEKRYTMSDTEAQGLLVRVEPSGGNHFYCDYRNPRTGKRVQRRLCLTSELTVTQVRDLVQKIRVSVRTDGVGPTQMERGHACTAIPGRTGPALHTLEERHRKSVRQSQIMLESFNELFPSVAEESAPTHITRWKQNHSA